MKKFKIYILGGICGVLAVVSIFMTIETATSGSEMADLQKNEAKLLAERQDLQSNLVESLSVSSLQEKGTDMGFAKINNLVYVIDNVPVARLYGQ